MGGVAAMLPVLKLLEEDGHHVHLCFHKDAPGLSPVSGSGFTPSILDEDSGVESIFEKERPDVVFVGISTVDSGSEKAAIHEARKRKIPIVGIVESWPHRWIEVYGERDIPIYKECDAFCVPDDLSAQFMVSRGFGSERLRVTGNPVWDVLTERALQKNLYRKEMREKFAIPEDAILLLWVGTADMDSPVEDRPEYCEWIGYSEKAAVEEFLATIQEVRNGGANVFGVIRIKPTLSGKWVQDAIARICPSVVFDKAPYLGGAPTILAADMVFGTFTLALQQAGIMGIPAVSYLPHLISGKDLISNEVGVTAPLYEQWDLSGVMRAIAFFPDITIAHLPVKTKTSSFITNASQNVANVLRSLMK